LGDIPMKGLYSNLRTIHLLAGAFALPALAMYGVSAVQMAHNRWFVMKPAVSEADQAMHRDYTDGRALVRDLMARRSLAGEITSVEATPAGFAARIAVPGTVHEIRYDRASGNAHIRTSVAGFMGMLNRLHHAAGLWHDYGPMKLWAVLVALVSLATVVLGATGIWMWWLRRSERMWGLILIVSNLVFSVTVLWMMRAAGP
jgi:hypothetical protein